MAGVSVLTKAVLTNVSNGVARTFRGAYMAGVFVSTNVSQVTKVSQRALRQPSARPGVHTWRACSYQHTSLK